MVSEFWSVIFIGLAPTIAYVLFLFFNKVRLALPTLVSEQTSHAGRERYALVTKLSIISDERDTLKHRISNLLDEYEPSLKIVRTFTERIVKRESEVIPANTELGVFAAIEFMNDPKRISAHSTLGAIRTTVHFSKNDQAIVTASGEWRRNDRDDDFMGLFAGNKGHPPTTPGDKNILIVALRGAKTGHIYAADPITTSAKSDDQIAYYKLPALPLHVVVEFDGHKLKKVFEFDLIADESSEFRLTETSLPTR